MTIHASVEIPNGLCLPKGLRGLLESHKHPFPQSSAGRVHSRSIPAGHLHEVVCKLQKAFAPSSMATPRENGELFIAIADRHLSGQGTWKLQSHLSWPSALGFLADALFRNEMGEQMGGLLTGSKYFPEPRKQGDCCSSHSHRWLCSTERLYTQLS